MIRLIVALYSVLFMTSNLLAAPVQTVKTDVDFNGGWSTFTTVGLWKNGISTTTVYNTIRPTGTIETNEIVTNRITFADKSVISSRYFINVKDYGAKGDGVTDDTAALRTAILACGTTGTLFLSDGTYNVTSTTGNFALIAKCCILGASPKNCVIYNTGTGSALCLQGSAYYSKWENFSVKGNALSQDGIVTSSSTDQTSYCSFQSVWSTYNGRNGLVHRMAWGTRYYDCKFQFNSGLGVYVDREPADAGGATSLSFIGCDSRWNGGTGDATTDYMKGGVRIAHCVSFAWLRGVVESNNAWGFIISSNTTAPNYLEQISIDGVHFENTPRSDSSSTVGGCVYTSGDWDNLSIQNCWISYGAATPATGYAFYIVSSSCNPFGYPTMTRKFYHRNNWLAPYGTGTNIDWYRSGVYTENHEDSIAIGSLVDGVYTLKGISCTARLKLTTPSLYDVYYNTDTRKIYISSGAVPYGFVAGPEFGATD